MNVITFPKSEWQSLKSRLDDGKIVYTIRVDNEYGKYKLGDVLDTEWGLKVQIISVKQISGGLEELKNEYKFFGELTKDMIGQLSGYDEMEIITLEAE